MKSPVFLAFSFCAVWTLDAQAFESKWLLGRRQQRHASLFFFSNPKQRLARNQFKQQTIAMTHSPNNDEPKKRLSIPLFGFCFQVAKPDSWVFLAFVVFAFVRYSITKRDFLFGMFYPLYLMVINQFRFDQNLPNANLPFVPLLREGRGPWFGRYVLFFGLTGVIVPFLYLLSAPLHLGQLAAPHFFLVSMQVFVEVLSQTQTCHALVRLLVPIGFNAYRVPVLMDWVADSGHSVSSIISAGSTSLSAENIVAYTGYGLAILNLVCWVYNLFVFLLLRAVPQYLDKSNFGSPDVKWAGQLAPLLSSNKENQ